MWIGIDVGGRRKGLHLAAIRPDEELSLDQARGNSQTEDALEWIQQFEPIRCVAIDAPADWAADSELSYRACEKCFRSKGICNIFYTPTQAVGERRARRNGGDGHYEWIECGIELRRRLVARYGNEMIVECFPTASLTRWGTRREGSRARWSRNVLTNRWGGRFEVSKARNQDQRDALAAALTALQFDTAPESMEAFGPLQVPRERPT